MADTNWPYDFRAAEERLDLTEITNQGLFFLKRSLNIGRTVAFVGVGGSMPYGRISWGELGSVQISQIIETFEPCKKKPSFQQSAIRPLVEQLEELRKKVNDEDGDTITLSMQIAEQVWTLANEKQLPRLREKFDLKDAPSDASGAQLFRKAIMRETVDATSHIKRILSNPFKIIESDRINTIKIKPSDLKRFPSNTQSLHRLFSRETIDAISALAEKISDDIQKDKTALDCEKLAARAAFDIACLMKAAATSAEDAYGIQPVRYYSLGLLLDLLRFSLLEAKLGDLDGIAAVLESNLNENSEWSRARLIPSNDDPLWLLHERLGIKRFITTNYDLEIERMFAHAGFAPTAYPAQEHLTGEDIERIGNMGGRSREIVLRESSVADFIDFAAGSGTYLAQVAHIHGRATEGNEIVVTDRDYQRTYIGERPEQKLQISAREGFEILFGGNPILFIGLSLAEGDVMRPLREFASQNIRRNNSVIALKEATASSAERAVFTLQQYIRHRIYVVHYGFREDSRDSWLEAFQIYFKALVSFIDGIVAAKWPVPPDHIKNAREEIDKLGDKLARAVGASSWHSDQFGNTFKLVSDGSHCDINFEFALVYDVAKFLFEALSKDLQETNTKSHALLAVTLRRALTRARNGVLTAALNARLRGLLKEWQEWADSWLKPPDERIADRHFRLGRRAPIHPQDALYLRGTPLPEVIVPEHAEYSHRISALYEAHWYRQLFEDPDTVLALTQSTFSPAAINFLRSQSGKYSGKRVFIISGPRGAGKGAIFSELSRYGDFLLQPGATITNWNNRPEKRYAGQFIASLSFSSEIASIWDSLIAFFIDPTRRASEIMASPAWEEKEGMGRIEQFRIALQGAQVAAEAARLKIIGAASPERLGMNVEARLLVVLHAFDLLVEKDGYPKNSEIRLLCDELLKAEGIPVDFVFICREDKIPLYFRNETLRKKLHDDRCRKCEQQIPMLLHDPQIIKESEEFSAVRASINRSGLATEDHIDAPHVFAYVLPPWTPGPDASKVLPRSVWHNRFLATLYLLVTRDMEARGRAADIRDFKAQSDQSKSSRGRDSSDDIIDHILRYWAERIPDPKVDRSAVLGVPRLPVDPDQASGFSDDDIKAASDFTLLELLIRHLAVISVPVDAEVLATCPQIRRRILALLPPKEEVGIRPLDEHQVSIIRLALAILCSRGITFRFFTPSLAVTDTSESQIGLQQRYQVHRLLQLYIYRRMGSQNVEPADAYFFSASIYASQTRELPTLGANAYAFLSDLVDGLIGYQRSEIKTPEPAAAAVLARRLRAAIGLARTLFSIGVVARFANLREVGIPHPPRIGYFEHHRLVLRWMLLASKKLDKIGGGGATPYLPPFYRDEILWLYNEAGVFSLAQGQCDDASALLAVALAQARHIEGPDSSPIRRRILVNLGTCEINRGRLGRAREQLTEVFNASDEDETVRMIARGYLGLIEHIEGSLVEALKFYDVAIDTLRDLGRSRPVSLFLCYRAELRRHRRDSDGAETDLRDAVDIARRAGYEDTAWSAMVSTARMQAAQENRASEFPKISSILAEAEDYVEAMDIPFLRCEISYARAIILLKQGEFILAGQQATRAIRTATLNGLSLRALAYRNLLADIHLKRGWTEQSQRMKTHIREAARSIGYRLLLQRMTKAE